MRQGASGSTKMQAVYGGWGGCLGGGARRMVGKVEGMLQLTIAATRKPRHRTNPLDMSTSLNMNRARPRKRRTELITRTSERAVRSTDTMCREVQLLIGLRRYRIRRRINSSMKHN